MSLLFEVSDGVAVITLNRPEVRNAIDRATAEAISDALDEMDARDDIAVGLLTGRGSVFCAGADLKAFRATGLLPVTARRGGMGMVDVPASKPMIAAVEGQALGGGFEIALACDFIVATDDALFGLPEVKHGLVPAGGGILQLPHRVPRSVALQMILTGDPIDARRAADLGLVNQLVASGTVFDAAYAMARSIAANAPLSVRAAKRLFDESLGCSWEQAVRLQTAITQPVLESNDAAEGARAFSEGRPPQWSGT